MEVLPGAPLELGSYHHSVQGSIIGIISTRCHQAPHLLPVGHIPSFSEWMNNWREFIHIHTHTWITTTWLLWMNEWMNVCCYSTPCCSFTPILLLLCLYCPSTPLIFAPYYTTLFLHCIFSLELLCKCCFVRLLLLLLVVWQTSKTNKVRARITKQGLGAKEEQSMSPALPISPILLVFWFT